MRSFVLVQFFNHIGKVGSFLFRWWFGRCILGANSHRWRCNVVHEVEFEVFAGPEIQRNRHGYRRCKTLRPFLASNHNWKFDALTHWMWNSRWFRYPMYQVALAIFVPSISNSIPTVLRLPISDTFCPTHQQTVPALRSDPNMVCSNRPRCVALIPFYVGLICLFIFSKYFFNIWFTRFLFILRALVMKTTKCQNRQFSKSYRGRHLSVVHQIPYTRLPLLSTAIYSKIDHSSKN